MRVLSFFPFEAASQELIRSAAPNLDVTFAATDTQAVIDRVSDDRVEVLLSLYGPSDPARMPALKWVATVSAGAEHLRATDPWSKRLIVTNGSGLQAPGIAEYVVTHMLMATQRTLDRLEAQQAHRSAVFRTPEWHHFAGRRLRGSTVLIIGYGSVGREVARLCSLLDVTVLAIKADPSVRADRGFSLPGSGDPDGVIPERIAGPEATRDLLSRADFVVLTLPLTKASERMVDGDFLAAMRRDAWLINIARGGHVVERDLVEALRARRIGGAVLDVTDTEPLPASSALWTAPNIVLTPHIAGISGEPQFWRGAAILLSENLARYTAGRPLLNVLPNADSY